MSSFGNYNYQKKLRKATIAFGSWFNSFVIRRTRADGSVEDYRVPIAYGPKEKWVRRLQEMSSISDNTKVQISLPFMSYVITSLRIDRSRQRNRTSERIVNIDGTDAQNIGVEIPVNITFNLFIYTRRISDLLGLTEHMVVNFKPGEMLTLDYDDGVNSNVEVSLSLLPGLIMNERYDGDFDTRRTNIASFSFEMKTYLFPSTTDTTVIDTLDVDTELDDD